MKVLIVGAGPTGLTAGVELARHGVDVTIIDKKPSGSTLSRAVGINPLSLKRLEASGVTKSLLSQGIRYQAAVVHSGRKPWATLKIDDPKPECYGYTFMLGLPQDQTEAILSERFTALNGRLIYNTTLSAIKQNKESVTITTTEGDTFTGDYLIGADGVHSTTRELLKIKSHAKTLKKPWSIADIETTELNYSDSVALYILKHGNLVFIAPIEKHRFRLVSNTEKALDTLPTPLKNKTIRREGKFEIKISQVETYQQGRVFLAGDAAHSHSPVGGRGMNLGIDDACDLAERLVSGKLQGYSDARHKVAKKIITGSEVLRKTVSASNPLIRYFVLMCIKFMSKVPAARQRFASKFLYG